MDWSPKTNYNRTLYKALDTPNLVESSLSVTSLRDIRMAALASFYIIE